MNCDSVSQSYYFDIHSLLLCKSLRKGQIIPSPRISGILWHLGSLKPGRGSQTTSVVLRKCHLTRISLQFGGILFLIPLPCPNSLKGSSFHLFCFVTFSQRAHIFPWPSKWKSSTDGLLTFPPVFIFLLPLSIRLPLPLSLPRPS